MKTKAGLIVTLSVFFIFISLTQCSDECKVTNTYIYYEPVYSTSAEIKAAVELQPPHTLTDLGKIYFKDGYLFINEVGKGIHIIDNRNPSSPQSLSFLKIPGNYDLAAYGDILYADSFTDLIAFNISDISNIKEVNRIEGLFNNTTVLGMMMTSTRGTITDWKQVDNVSVYERECNQQFWGGMLYEDGIALSSSSARSFKSTAAMVAPTTPTASAGKGGSMARFTISGNHLYAMDGGKLDIVSISSPEQPVEKKEINIAWDIETIFPHDSNLFFGTQSGMLIYDIQDAENPSLVSTYTHIRSCDPVVVEGNYAYVTLRNGSTCGGFTNQLEVIDITNLKSPVLTKTCAMTNPFGLGIDNGTLFVCDGSSGLRVFDATDINQVCNKPLAHYENIQALDIIPFENVAMMIGKDGLYQYDYSKPSDIKLLSTLSLKQ